MKLLDSNIIIYSSLVQYDYLKSLVFDNTNAVSAITTLEVLGYPKITETEKRYFAYVFEVLPVLGVSQAVVGQAIRLRQQHKLKSNDAIIAATALLHNLELYSRNTDNFRSIPELKLVNPIH